MPDGRTLAEALNSSTRLQAVKCSPRTQRSRRDPRGAMDRLCPPRYLRQELALLRPGTVIAFGYPPWTALDALAVRHEESIGGEHFARARMQIDGLAFELFWLQHPSGRGDRWKQSLSLLLDELRARPAGSAPA